LLALLLNCKQHETTNFFFSCFISRGDDHRAQFTCFFIAFARISFMIVINFTFLGDRRGGDSDNDDDDDDDDDDEQMMIEPQLLLDEFDEPVEFKYNPDTDSNSNTPRQGTTPGFKWDEQQQQQPDDSSANAEAAATTLTANAKTDAHPIGRHGTAIGGVHHRRRGKVTTKAGQQASALIGTQAAAAEWRAQDTNGKRRQQHFERAKRHEQQRVH